MKNCEGKWHWKTICKYAKFNIETEFHVHSTHGLLQRLHESRACEEFCHMYTPWSPLLLKYSYECCSLKYWKYWKIERFEGKNSYRVSDPLFILNNCISTYKYVACSYLRM